MIVTRDLEATVYRLLRMNPCVAQHELRLRMRGTRAFWVLFAYAGIAAGIFLIAMWVTVWAEAQMRGAGMPEPNLGRIILGVIVYTQLVLLLLVLPAYSAGAITMEREKRTLEMLRATLLTASDVVSGKLLVVLGLGLILLLTSLPIASWSLLLGGVAPEEVFYLYTYLLVTGCFAATLGMLFSTLLGRSVGAVVATYGTLLALMIVPLILIGIYVTTVQFSGGPGSQTLGDIWGAILLTAGSLVVAWLVYLGIRWVWRRLLGDRLFLVSHLFAAVAVLILLSLVLWPGSPALTGAAGLSVGWIAILQPFISLASIMEGSGAAGIPLGLARGGSQPLIWSVCTGTALVAALLCWATSIRVYRARR